MQKGSKARPETLVKHKAYWAKQRELKKTLQDFYNYYYPHESEIKKALSYYNLQRSLGKV